MTPWKKALPALLIGPFTYLAMVLIFTMQARRAVVL